MHLLRRYVMTEPVRKDSTDKLHLLCGSSQSDADRQHIKYHHVSATLQETLHVCISASVLVPQHSNSSEASRIYSTQCHLCIKNSPRHAHSPQSFICSSLKKSYTSAL